MPRYSLNYLLFWLLLGLASMLILTRIVPQLRFFFPVLLLILIIIWGIWAWREWSKRQAFENSKEGAIHSKINFCREEINRNKKEIADILENIAELTTRLNENIELTAAYRQETTALINDFKKEQQLRTARIDFYETCIRKLEALLHHQQMAQTLARKKEKLKQLKEQNYETLADMEALRSDVEFDAFYLDTIDELSSRMSRSTTVDDAEGLRIELEKMTREMKNL
ncbi:MAG: hypothetical protein HUU34_02545 [Saprospiraceae bacterium]|jgi:hypothetical protein|nr:hypothetical protein [Saprospiraceae bacterium]